MTTINNHAITVQELLEILKLENTRVVGLSSDDREFECDDIFIENIELACEELGLVNIKAKDIPAIQRAFYNQKWIITVEGDMYSNGVESYNVDYDCSGGAYDTFHSVFTQEFIDELFNPAHFE